VLRKVGGLLPEQLVLRSCPPSTMSLISQVRHLTEMQRVYAQRREEPDLGHADLLRERIDGATGE
jgi:hypothetical protein